MCICYIDVDVLKGIYNVHINGVFIRFVTFIRAKLVAVRVLLLRKTRFELLGVLK